MTQDKMRKIITAIVSACTLFLTLLSAFLIYQWATIAVYDHRIDRVAKENAALEEAIKEGEEYVEYLEQPLIKDWLAFEYGFIEGNK